MAGEKPRQTIASAKFVVERLALLPPEAARIVGAELEKLGIRRHELRGRLGACRSNPPKPISGGPQIVDRAEILDPEPNVEVIIRSYRLQTEFSDRLLVLLCHKTLDDGLPGVP